MISEAGKVLLPAAADVVVPSGTLTEPGGVVRTADGKLWVADGLMGICEVRDGLLIPSPYCQPEVEGPEEEEAVAHARAG